MKKHLSLICMMLLCALQINAQEPQFVSKEPTNRNVLIEELTGRLCGWCPLGQYTVNQIIEQHPERVYTVNIHRESTLSPTNYPNLNTLKGADIADAFSEGVLPAAVINRSTDKAIGLSGNEWATLTNQQLQQAAECNIAGQVSINHDTRLARITVEVYYTADSDYESNYLNVIMLQDSIVGSQSGAEDNPAQVVNGQYCHMHIYRNTITSKWGDEISPTTAGTLITETFKYTIPEKIGEPNGVNVDLDNVHFLAFVTEKREGSVKTFPILNVTELTNVKPGESVEDIIETSYNIYPNPAKDYLTIEGENISQINIINTLGQVVKSVKCNDDNIQINVCDLENGMYFVNIIGNNGDMFTRKLTINN